MSWLRQRSAVDPAPARQGALRPVRLYSADGVVMGWLDPGEERLSDILQRGDPLSILPDGADQQTPSEWLPVDVHLLLLVVPPPHTTRPEKRLHRQREPVQVRLGPYVVSGTAHLKPGEGQDVFMRARQPFLPLTDALIERSERAPEHVDVVIVNLALMEEFREL